MAAEKIEQSKHSATSKKYGRYVKLNKGRIKKENKVI